ncbi:MAG: hypothetical protein LC737_07425, partial [Chloroflexi bacterium]|nr:hypothetical protein [Chloroflexota bacterium]
VSLVPTNTPRPRATNTAVPPPNTPVPAFPVLFQWINGGQPFTANQCTFVNGTHVEGKVYKKDGSLLLNAQRSAAMHLWIRGDSGGIFAYPGVYKQFPTESDGRWNAEFPKRATDFEWHIFISAPLSDDPISADLGAVASGVSKCGQAGSANWFVADWHLQ